MLKRIMSTVLKSHEETFDIDSNPHPQYLEKATTADSRHILVERPKLRCLIGCPKVGFWSVCKLAS